MLLACSGALHAKVITFGRKTQIPNEAFAFKDLLSEDHDRFDDGVVIR